MLVKVILGFVNICGKGNDHELNMNNLILSWRFRILRRFGRDNDLFLAERSVNTDRIRRES